MIEITQKAAQYFLSTIKETQILRLSVLPSGCTGWQYQFSPEDPTNVSGDDVELKFNGLVVVVKERYRGYIQGSVIDYQTNRFGGNITVSNPKAIDTCGCGNSFSVE